MNDQHTKIRTIDQHLPKFRSKCGTFDLGITVTQWKSPAEHRYHFQLANADIWEIQKWAQLFLNQWFSTFSNAAAHYKT